MKILNSLSSSASSFLTQNWLWFTIGISVCIALALIVLISVLIAKNVKAKKLKQKSEENLPAKEENQKVEAGEDEKSSTKQEPEIKENTNEKEEVKNNLEKNETSNLTVAQLAKMPVTEENLPYLLELIKLQMASKQTKEEPEEVKQEVVQRQEQKSFVSDRLNDIQKEYQEELRRIDEILHEQEKDKLKEEMRKEEELILKLQEEYDLADKLLEELNGQDSKDDKKEIPQIIYEERRIPVQEYVVEHDEANQAEVRKEEIKNEMPLRQETKLDANKPSEKNEEGVVLPDDAVVFAPVKKLSLQEAYEKLSGKQRQYFNKLRDYADKKPDSRAKQTKTHLAIGCGNKNYIRLAIKRNVTYAYFAMESEEMLRMRLDENLGLKPEETQVKITDDKAFEMAKHMIDMRVKQVEREKEMLKEIRKEKMRKNYAKRKNN